MKGERAGLILGVCGLAAALALLIPLPHARAQDSDVAALQRRATEAFEKGDFGAARDALVKLVALRGDSAAAHYNLACARAQTGDLAGASASLLDAVTWGYVDFHHMAADPHLAPLRTTEAWEELMLGWRGLLDARGDANLDSARKAFVAGYRHEKDDRLRLVYSAAFDEKTFAEARAEIDAVARFAFEELFPSLSFDDGTDPRPDAWVSVILPTPEDFVRMVRSPGVGGFYDNDRRRLISQDVGPSLRHEFLHVLHWRVLARLGQKHPDWIMEGLGCLVEDVARVEGPAGPALRPLPSWRTNIVKRLAARNALAPLRRLANMPREQFVGSRPNANYAQSRAVMMHLRELGRLGAFFGAYCRGYDADPTGVRALEEAVGTRLEEFDRAHKAWIAALPEVAERVRPGMASLGVVVGPGRGDGPVVEDVDRRPGRRAVPADGGADALRARDVIVALDGEQTRTMEDLVRVLSGCEPGQAVDVDVRRGTRRLTMRLVLVPAPADP